MNDYDADRDPLDELLGAARWPEVDAARLARLDREWRRTLARRRAARLAWSFGALAPAAAAAIVAAVILAHAPDAPVVAERKPLDVHNHEIESPMDDLRIAPPRAVVAENVVPDAPDSHDAAPELVREPTAYERMMAALHRQQVGAAVVAVWTPDEPRPDAVNAAIERLAADPALDAGSLAGQLAHSETQCESRLLAALTHETDPAKRRAALRLLSHQATRTSYGALLAAANDADCPNETLRSAARLSTDVELSGLASRAALPERRVAFAAELLSRGGELPVEAFLALVEDDATAPAALAGVRSIESPPVDELFAALFHSRVATRMAAARTLGALGRPAVSERLARMAVEGLGRREALAALLSSDDAVAGRFLDFARRDAILASSVRALAPRFTSRAVPPVSFPPGRGSG